MFELVNFATGLQREQEVIFNAIHEKWSNGQTEGQVTRLKIIKRKMYGRANFDLLRLRVLSSTCH
jgi:transposase